MNDVFFYEFDVEIMNTSHRNLFANETWFLNAVCGRVQKILMKNAIDIRLSGWAGYITC